MDEFFTEILRIVIWPLTVLFVVNMAKPFAQYLFLSIRSFNILGVKGEIRPVDEVILEKANELIKQDKEKQLLAKLAKITDGKEITEDDIAKFEAAISKKGGLTLSDVIELFIALEIISKDKIEQARAVVNTPYN